MSVVYSREGFLVFTCLILFSTYFVSVKQNDKLFLILFILSLYFGLRPINIGTDTINYYEYFNNLDMSWMESGFTLLNRVFYRFIPSAKIFMLFVNFLFLCFTFFFYNKNFGDKFYSLLSLVVLVFLPYGMQMSVNIIRQGLASAIFLFSIANYEASKAILAKKERKYNLLMSFLLFIVSVSIHNSTLLFGLLYLVSISAYDLFFEKLDKNHQLFLFLILILISAVGIPYKIISYMPLDRIKRKLESFSVEGRSMWLLFKNVLYFLFVYLYQFFLKNNQETKHMNRLIVYYNVLLFSSVIFSFSYITSTRILPMLDFLIPIFCLDILILFSKRYNSIKQKQILVFFLILFFFSVFIYSYSSGMISTFNW